MKRQSLWTLALILSLGFGFSSSRKSPAPDFSGTTLDGKTMRLSELRGKVVLLDFWASWCGPCKKEMPFLVRLHETLKDQDFTVLGVNVDTDRQKVEAFLAKLKDKPGFPIIFDSKGSIAERYRLQGMPTTLIIDRNGVVQYEHTGFKEKDKQKVLAKLKELL